jgi:hypothetical protein
VALADVDGDGFLELLVERTPGVVTAYHAQDGELYWSSAPHEQVEHFGPPLAYDDGTAAGMRIVVAVRSEFAPGIFGLETFDAATGSSLTGLLPLEADALAVRGEATNGSSELYVSMNEGEIRRVDPMTGEIATAVGSFGVAIHSFTFVDLDRDGVEDLVGAAADGRLRWIDGANGTIGWTSPYLGPYLDELQSGDFDSNGIPEIMAKTYLGIVRYVGPLLELFFDSFESGDTSAWSATAP